MFVERQKGRNDHVVIYFLNILGSTYEQGVTPKSLLQSQRPKESKIGLPMDLNQQKSRTRKRKNRRRIETRKVICLTTKEWIKPKILTQEKTQQAIWAYVPIVYARVDNHNYGKGNLHMQEEHPHKQV